MGQECEDEAWHSLEDLAWPIRAEQIPEEGEQIQEEDEQDREDQGRTDGNLIEGVVWKCEQLKLLKLKCYKLVISFSILKILNCHLIVKTNKL